MKQTDMICILLSIIILGLILFIIKNKVDNFEYNKDLKVKNPIQGFTIESGQVYNLSKSSTLIGKLTINKGGTLNISADLTIKTGHINCDGGIINMKSGILAIFNSGKFSIHLLKSNLNVIGGTITISNTTSSNKGSIGIMLDNSTMKLSSSGKINVQNTNGTNGIYLKSSKFDVTGGTATVSNAETTSVSTGIFLDNSTMSLSLSGIINVQNTNNTYGIYLKSSKFDVTSGTLTISNKGSYGIYLNNSIMKLSSAGNIKVHNTNSTYGIYLIKSSKLDVTGGTICGSGGISSDLYIFFTLKPC